MTAPAPAAVAILPPLAHPVRRFGRRVVDFSRETVVMAIVNRTPDSFYDRGRTYALDAAVAAGVRAAEAGAAWIDVGGQPFAPGQRLTAQEEAARVLPVIRELRAATSAILSVDTFEPDVAAVCIEAGADVVNDTTGLRDRRMAAVIADGGAHVVLTHSLAPPRAVIPPPRYADVVAEVREFLARQADAAVAAGIAEDRIMLDPGHDLNKNTLHSLELTRRFAEIADLGFPALAAVSNKDFIGETVDAGVEGRLPGTIAAAVVCLLLGARILRMHDVTAAVSAVRMTEAILGFRPPALLRHNVDPDSPVPPWT